MALVYSGRALHWVYCLTSMNKRLVGSVFTTRPLFLIGVNLTYVYICEIVLQSKRFLSHEY